ncbi:MAG: hypothetical protein F7B20_05600 [Aeropyrum sp.]|nr:hypothetical protein [Aeropyrum sp.]
MRLSARRSSELISWYVREFGWRTLENDRRRFARAAKSIRQWMSDPRRFDLPGVDRPPGRRRHRGRQRRLTRWLPRTRRRTRSRVGTQARKRRRPSSYEQQLADRIWGVMRRYKGYKYSHARALAREIMSLGIDPEEIDIYSLDYGLEFGELVNQVTRRYRLGRRLYNPAYMEYMESRLREKQPMTTSFVREPESWEIHYWDEALLL